MRILALLLLLNISTLSAQNSSTVHKDKPETVINEVLERSKTFAQIESLMNILSSKSKLKKYREYFLQIPCINPLNPNNNIKTTSEYGTRFHPIDKKYKHHNGIDIATNLGTTVHASASGRVKRIIFSNKGYGNRVEISHGYGFESRYAHMSIIFVLKVGQEVKLGQVIGMVGSTGKSTGNHLHYEILKNGKSFDPKDSFHIYKRLFSNVKL